MNKFFEEEGEGAGQGCQSCKKKLFHSNTFERGVLKNNLEKVTF
jgi:hypothetical protein